mgnify:CR=1
FFKRKIHKIATAYTGGMAISITFVISNLIFDINMNNLNSKHLVRLDNS